MLRQMRTWLLAGVVAVGLWLMSPTDAHAQYPGTTPNLDRFYYYPYHLFPHNYWPQASPTWPERPGEPYTPPPAYMSYPPFHEPHWRYDMHQPMSYYRGFHFWLDAF